MATTITDPWLSASLAFPATRCGPPGVVNGGWVSGTVAAHLAGRGGGPVEVTLRAPTPLDTPVDLRVADDHATLTAGDATLVSARRSPGRMAAPGPVAWADARRAEAHFAGHADHPFPGCFVCGTERALGDGLRIFPGPVGRPGTVAALVTPGPGHAGPGGRLPIATVWAALDCPTAWVNMRPGDVVLLGRLRAEVRADLWAGETYLVVAETAGIEDRKAHGRAALYDRDGRLLAASAATWVRVGGSPAVPAAGRARLAR